MLFVAHMYISSKLRLLGTFLLCLAGFWALVNFGILEAIMAFCFSGLVPGTALQLSPMAALTTSVLSVTLIFFILIELMLLEHRRRQRHQDRPVIFNPRRMPLPDYLVLAEPDPSHRRVRQLGIVLPLTRRFVAKVVGVAGLVIVGILKIVTGVFYAVYVAGKMAVLGTGRSLLGLCSAVWMWAEPLLWQLDGWLEHQTRRFWSRAAAWLDRVW